MPAPRGERALPVDDSVEDVPSRAAGRAARAIELDHDKTVAEDDPTADESTPTRESRKDTTTKAAEPGRQRKRTSPVMILGIFLIILGLLAGGYFAWQYWGTNITTAREQDKAKTGLRDEWKKPNPVAGKAADAQPAPKPGDAYALMRIPALGAEWEFAVFAGTDTATLEKGLGWYTNTALPGRVGNFAVAGHRAGHGAPFERLLELNPGDKVILETQGYVFTYEITTRAGDLTVTDKEGGWVLDPVPGKPGQKPTEAMITLTTCTDFLMSPNRSVAFGHLISTQKK